MKIFVSRSIRLIGAALLVTALAVSFACRPAAVRAAQDDSKAAAVSAGRVPVLVELFTSEGCSSCPPADALLAKLDAKQPVDGAQVIVLSEHVTYWNRLGWTDPFSFEAMTERQQRYARRLGLGEVYTPQAVVDGAADVVGSDERGLERAIAKEVALASAHPRPDLQIVEAHWSGDSVEFSVRGAGDGKAVLVAALAEDSVQSYVKRGENADRNLRHVAVVRVMQEMGKRTADGRELSLKLPTESAKSRGAMRLVVFLADGDDGRVLAVAQQPVVR